MASIGFLNFLDNEPVFLEMRLLSIPSTRWVHCLQWWNSFFWQSYTKFTSPIVIYNFIDRVQYDLKNIVRLDCDIKYCYL